jgi:hypothetical protein
LKEKPQARLITKQELGKLFVYKLKLNYFLVEPITIGIYGYMGVRISHT